MTIDNINVEETLEKTEKLLQEEKGISPALKGTIEILLLLIRILVGRMNLNSRNSSQPPSSDQNRPKKNKTSGNRKPGGQQGREGKTIEQIEDPDEIQEIQIDRSVLPTGDYEEVGYESRQVIDIQVSRFVTEYRAQILEGKNGERFVATFPEQVTRPVQYGSTLKAHVVYLSQYQLIPYHRVEEYFREQLHIPISVGSIFNFNEEAFEELEEFEALLKEKLKSEPLVHFDETGMNINSKRHWLHCASTSLWTFFFSHEKRGQKAMDEMGILPSFLGIACHDHWKSYFCYQCTHALCNAHHLRELEWAWENEKQNWAKDFKELLLEIKKKVDQAGGVLSKALSQKYRRKYQKLLQKAEKECPPPKESERNGKRGKLKRSKSRNLLERLIHFENDVLRFMEDPIVPFTNNQGENDIRMTKVHQKISGCFRSEKGSQMFCRIRGYVSTCRKHSLSATEVLRLLFEKKITDVYDSLFNSD